MIALGLSAVETTFGGLAAILRGTPEPPADLDALLPAENSLRRAGTLSKRAVAAAHRVVPAARERVGVYVAQQHGAIDMCAQFVAASHRGNPRLVSPLLFTEAVENIAATHLSLTLRLTGVVTTFTGTRVAALQAVAAARDDIAAGAVDAGLVVALSQANDVMEAAYGAVHRHACGLRLSEGAGALLVQRGPGPRIFYADACTFGSRRADQEAAVRHVWRACCEVVRPARVLASAPAFARGREVIAAALGSDAVPVDPPTAAFGEAFALDPVLQLLGDLERAPKAGPRALVCLSEEGTAGVMVVE